MPTSETFAFMCFRNGAIVRYDEIARKDMIGFVEKLVTAGRPALANRVQALVSSISSSALDVDLVDRNPAARLRKRDAETARTRVLSDDELRLFWEAIGAASRVEAGRPCSSLVPVD